MNSMILKESHFKQIRHEKFDLAVLPWGATEAHNYHLPYGTDNYEAEAIAKESARLAEEKGARLILLPGIPYGVNTGQSDIPLTINMYPSTQMMVLRDILESLQRGGIFKLLIVNSHGGNDFKQILRELGAEFKDMILATCNWYQSIERSEIFENEGDHADELETSLMMHLHPDVVLSLEEAGNGSFKKFTVKALNEGWAWTERKWTQVSEDTGIGDPSKASAEKGEKYFRRVCEKISQLMVEFSTADKNSFYK
jgi:creatinine amidohydrolase